MRRVECVSSGCGNVSQRCVNVEEMLRTVEEMLQHGNNVRGCVGEKSAC